VANEIQRFYEERALRVAGYSDIKRRHRDFLTELIDHDYEYNFDMLGRPIIQLPQDIVAMQEIIWKVKPDLIIETGIAHGGSLILSASMLALLDYCEAVQKGGAFDPRATARRVVGVDIDIRAHNLAAIKGHPMSHMIQLIEGSSTAPDVVANVRDISRGFNRILVCLDSNHTHEHVLHELEAYAPLVTAGSYCCVFDTVIEDVPPKDPTHRPWNKGNNPKTAVWEFLRRLKEEGRVGADGAKLNFEIDKTIEDKLLITVAPDGYLRRLENAGSTA